jgi:outer membrane lipoprotein-sorting protein
VRHLAKLLVVAAAFCAFAASAEEVTVTKELQAAMQDIAVHSKVVTVDGSGVTPGNFKQDSDPATLQIVMLDKPSDGAAQVSSDGEVIFLQKDTSEKEQQSLFATAFYLKAKAREVASQPAGAHSSL